MITFFGRPIGPKALVIAAMGVAAVATLGILQASSDAEALAPPPCASPASQNGLSVNGLQDCMTQVGNWCAANHPEDASGLCMDKVFGYVPSNY